MRASIAALGILLAGAGAAGIAGAVDTTGSNLSLNGPDGLSDLTQAVMGSCDTAFSDFVGQQLMYLGGGATVGTGQMMGDNQKMSPLTRSLKNTEYCAIASPASPGLTESLLLGLDSVAVVSNETSSCSSDATGANGLGSAAAFAVTSDGTPSGGTPATCPGCDATNNYTFGDAGGALYAGQPSFDALAVLYFGLTHDGTYDCAGPVRRSLIKNWRNLFATDCATGDATCAAGLTHAWRLDDLAEATDAFVSLLGPPGRGIGTMSTAPVGLTKKTNPFCNSFDANAGTTSFGGSSDFSDQDPIRTPCVAGQDGVCEGLPSGGSAGAFAGDLGVVQVIQLPDTFTALPSDFYPQKPCGMSCMYVTPFKGNQIPAGLSCPGGVAPIGGACLMPFAGPASAPDARCISAPTTKCADQMGKPDGRQYNLVTVVAASQIPTAQRGTQPFQFALDKNHRALYGSYYRIHAEAPGAGNAPDPTLGTTGLCRQGDSISQLGCLVDSDPCSVGVAGRNAAQSFPGPGSPLQTPLKALAVNGTPPFTPASVAPDPNLAIENLLAPPGTTPFYPLARRLYLTTIYGFTNLLGGEQELARCFGNNAIVGPAMTGDGFLAVPGGVQCLDYPEESSVTVMPPQNVQGSGNVAFVGCDLGLTGENACAASPPVISN